ncbi:enoyl-CoA hydratase/isomerase family protein [Neptuniibacter halophilus]|uniref:enoyl-CoA hydratase/isomerase family protein n=1 Tax=Neptuniibacter halophilus TaxID=651666 RepID=UPI0025734696|nr:enoyl-CoA hydratase-related protein [Neptuniibacter halophilus]
MSILVLSEKRGQVFEIILNRAEKKNALTLAMYAELVALLRQAASDDTVHVVLIRGEGRAFSAGNDIGDFVACAGDQDGISIIIEFLHTLAAFEKPVVAVVQGDAVGIGTTMMLHCDLVMAADDLRCQMPFVKLGLIPEGGSTLLLPQLLGQRKAFELLVEGRRFDAETAESIGLVNQTLAPEKLLETARSRAADLAGMPAEAVKISKRLMKQAYLEQLHRVMDDEGERFYQRLFSEEARAAFSAFLQQKS